MVRPGEIERLLEPYGLCVLGADHEEKRLLIGNAGSAMWLVFTANEEYSDGLPDPLDRWSRRVGEAVAGQLGARAVFPFDGPPYPPFLGWSLRSGRAFSSPLGMVIHEKHGLWHAYRFALEFDEALEQPSRQPGPVSPCLECREKPCLTACPVQAFRGGEYRVETCSGHLSAAEGQDCMQRGCAARRTCPVAPENQYDSGEHAAFHMRAFVFRGSR